MSRAAVLALCAVTLTACASLAAPVLKPDVSAEPATLPAGAWTLDEKHAALTFKINHLGYAGYVGRFERFSAVLDGDAKDPANARLTATIDMSSLDIANDDFARTLTGPDWFDAAAHPQAVFRSDKIKLTGPDTADITGTLTLKGRSAPVTLLARFNGGAFDRLRGANVIGFSATGTLRRSDFGVSKFSGLLTDEVSLDIEAEFTKAPS